MGDKYPRRQAPLEGAEVSPAVAPLCTPAPRHEVMPGGCPVAARLLGGLVPACGSPGPRGRARVRGGSRQALMQARVEGLGRTLWTTGCDSGQAPSP